MWKRRKRSEEARGETPAVLETADDVLRNAEGAFRSEDLAMAAVGFERFLDMDGGRDAPSNVEARSLALCRLAEIRGILKDQTACEGHVTEAIALARRTGDGRLLAQALIQAGWAAWHWGDLAVAEKLLEEAVTIARSHQDHIRLGPALLNLARVSFARDQWDQSRVLIDELMGLRTSVDALRQGALMARLLAREAGDFEKAMCYADAACNIVNRSPVLQRERLAGALSGRARAALDLGDVGVARSAVTQALILARQGDAGPSPHLAASDLAVEEEEWPLAESHLREAEEHAIRRAMTRGIRLQLADVLVSASRLDEAAALITSLRKETEPFRDYESAEILALEGQLHHAQGDLTGAVEALRAGWDTCRRIGWQASAATLSLQLGVVSAEAGDLEAASLHLAEITALSSRPSDQRRRQRLTASIAKGKR